jgi:hypothetical protein
MSWQSPFAFERLGSRRKASMRFMMLYRPADVKSMEAGTPPTEKHLAEMGKFTAEMAKSGALRTTDGLLPTAKGARVRQIAGKVTVVDGPFPDGSDFIGGFAIVEVKSIAEAVEIAKRFLKVAGDGESEIREMFPTAAFSR